MGTSNKNQIIICTAQSSPEWPDKLQEHRSEEQAPVLLRPLSLLLFSILLIILCVLTTLLWHFSRASDGFALRTANQYLLTYGPTAVLVLFVAAWRQADRLVKISSPWEELNNGASLAPKSILADYISTFQALALWSAFRNRHRTVITTTIGFVLLKVATLSSTGLFVLEPTAIHVTQSTSTEDSFGTRDLASLSDSSTFDQSLGYTTYGILVQGLQKPFGVGNGYAYAKFSASSLPGSDPSATVNVDAFLPSFECQSAALSIGRLSQNTTEAFPETLLQISSPACSVRAQDVSIYTLNPQRYRCPERQLSGLFVPIDCESSAFQKDDGTYNLLVVTDMRYSQELDQNDAKKELSDNVQAISWATEIAQVNAVVCRLSHTMGRATIVVNKGSSIVLSNIAQTSSSSSSVPQLENLTDYDFSSFVQGALSASGSMLGNRPMDAYSLQYPDPMSEMMASVAGGTYEDLLDPAKMSTAATMVMKQLGAQIAHQYLRLPDPEKAILYLVYTETHLKISTISAWVVFGALILVVVCCGNLFVLRRKSTDTFSCNSSTLTAGLLWKNPLLAEQMLCSRACKESELRALLENVEVLTLKELSSQPRISLSSPVEWPRQPIKHAFWWNPVTVSKVVLALTFVASCAVMVALELTQRKSDRNHGLVQLPALRSEFETAYVRFVPALVVLLIASSFNCLDFNTLLLIPFDALRRGSTQQNYTALQLVSQNPLSAFWMCMRRRYWSAIASSAAAVVGSLLTIVVSGLYTVEVFQQARAVDVNIHDTINPVWLSSVVNDSGAAVLSTLIENLNFPNPKGTFGEVVLPEWYIPGIGTLVNSSTPLEAMLPVWRADLDCVVLSSDNYSIASTQGPFQSSILVNATYQLPVDCMYGGPNGTEALITFDQSFMPLANQSLVYIGKLLDLHVGPYDAVIGESQGETVPSAMPDNPSGCPSLAFVYGVHDLANTSTDQQSSVQVQVCYQKIERLNANINFHDLDIQEIDTSQPPRLDENSAQYLFFADNTTSYVSQSENATSFQFRIQSHLDNEFALFNTGGGNTYSTSTTSDPTVDNFFQAVIFGQSPLPLTTLELNNQEQVNAIQDGILALYRRYMAQAISLNMRVNLTNSDLSVPVTKEVNGELSVNGTLIVPTRRLVQHNTSKLVLQAMLGFMLICGIVTVCTVRFHGLLPAAFNPCTIWGQLGLLAGSKIVRSYRPVDGSSLTEVISVEGSEVEWEELVAGGRLRLGWWEMEGGGKRYGMDMMD